MKCSEYAISLVRIRNSPLNYAQGQATCEPRLVATLRYIGIPEERDAVPLHSSGQDFVCDALSRSVDDEIAVAFDS